MKRPFYILHSHGVSEASAPTAAQALQKSFVPLGFRDALAVIDAAYVFTSRDTMSRAPFFGIVGKPVAGGNPR